MGGGCEVLPCGSLLFLDWSSIIPLLFLYYSSISLAFHPPYRHPPPGGDPANPRWAQRSRPAHFAAYAPLAAGSASCWPLCATSSRIPYGFTVTQWQA